MFIETAVDEAFGEAVALATTGAIEAKDLVAGYTFPINFVPKGNLGYMRAKYTVSGTATAGKITAGVVAAKTLVMRGHDVTLYEKEQLKLSISYPNENQINVNNKIKGGRKNEKNKSNDKIKNKIMSKLIENHGIKVECIETGKVYNTSTQVSLVAVPFNVIEYPSFIFIATPLFVAEIFFPYNFKKFILSPTLSIGASLSILGVPSCILLPCNEIRLIIVASSTLSCNIALLICPDKHPDRQIKPS